MPLKPVMCTLCILKGGKTLNQCKQTQENFTRHMDRIHLQKNNKDDPANPYKTNRQNVIL